MSFKTFMSIIQVVYAVGCFLSDSKTIKNDCANMRPVQYDRILLLSLYLAFHIIDITPLVERLVITIANLKSLILIAALLPQLIDAAHPLG